MGTPRVRNRNVVVDGGRCSIKSGPFGPGSSFTKLQVCEDVIPGPGALTITKYEEYKPQRINGTRTTGTGTDVFEDWVSPVMATFSFATLPTTSNVADATRAAANTNPSRPEVDLPVAFMELRDIPKMIKFFGDQALHLANPKKWGKPGLPSIGDRLANWNLNYQFGLRPLISDVAKLLDLGAAIDRRAREIDSLYRKGGLRRRMTLSIDEARNVEDDVTINSLGGTAYLIRGKRVTVTKRKRWAVVKWRPTTLPPMQSQRELLAARAVLGLNLSASQIWELIPWSWLFDYFQPIGAYLAANRNFIPAQLHEVWIMQFIDRQMTLTRTSGPSWLSGGGSFMREEHKSRRLTSISPFTVWLPNLSNTQLSILGSLAVVRARRR